MRNTLYRILLVAPAIPALAVQAQAPDPDSMEEVIVTGSHIRGNAGEQIARPVDVISVEDIKELGPRKLEAALRREPAFTGAVGSAGAGPDSGGRSTVNLRGLGEKYTLVLVNGRRFNAVDPTNINDIPASAVDSIEVLKDGSSSVYGSDAVAGVVNILLDTRFEGLKLTGSYGNTFGHDARQLEGSLKFGTGGERARITGTLQYRDTNATAQTDMALGREPNVSNLGGVEIDRYYTSPAVVILPDLGPVILDYHRFGIGEYSNNPDDYIPYDPYDYNQSPYNREERELFTDIAAERQYGGFLHGEVDLVPGSVTWFAEGVYAAGELTNQYVTWGLDFYGDPITDFGPVPASNPWNPFGVDLRDVQYAVPEVGPYGENYETDTWRVVTGLRGDVGSFNYEVAATYFESKEILRQLNLYSSSGLLEAINRPGPDAFNPFCNFCNTPEQMAGIRIPGNELTTTNTQTIFDARLSGPVARGDRYDLAFATGAEYRKEEYDFEVDELSLAGDIYYIQMFPDQRSRRTTAVFGELGYTLEDPGVSGLHRLKMELSGRYEDIEDVGGTFNPRLAVAWQPVSDAFTLRASYGTAFTAPPIDLLRAEQVLVNEVLFYPELDQSIPTDVLQGGNPDLDPETAQTLDFGVILRPTPSVSLTLDYFIIDQEDVVVIPDPQSIADGSFPGDVDFSGVRPRIEAVATNIAGRKVDGLDFAFGWLTETSSAGTWNLSLAGSYLTRFESNDGPGYESALGAIGVTSAGTEFGALPRLRGVASLDWSNAAGVDAGISLNYVHSYRDGDLPEGMTREVEEFMTVDLNFGYDFGRRIEGLSMRAGLINVFDEEPPFSNWWRWSTRYDRSTANSLGRYLFVSFEYAL